VVRVLFERPKVSRRVAITGRPVYSGDAPRAPQQDALGSPGTYEVTFILSTPGQDAFMEGIDITALLKAGSSLLQMPPGVVQARIAVSGGTGTGGFTLFPNDRGRVARAVISLRAATFVDAEVLAHDLVAPMLSWWSYRYDVPIDLQGWLVIEKATRATRVRVGVLGRAAITDNNRYASRPEHRFILSAYREGMNATNPVYQALCFYRVLEGAYRLRAKRRGAAGATFREPTNEVMPAGADLAALDFHDQAAIAPYAGRSFAYVRDDLRTLVRNAAAHLDPTGEQETLAADTYRDVTRCEDATSVLRYVARVVLENEFRADADLAPLL